MKSMSQIMQTHFRKKFLNLFDQFKGLNSVTLFFISFSSRYTSFKICLYRIYSYEYVYSSVRQYDCQKVNCEKVPMHKIVFSPVILLLCYAYFSEIVMYFSQIKTDQKLSKTALYQPFQI